MDLFKLSGAETEEKQAFDFNQDGHLRLKSQGSKRIIQEKEKRNQNGAISKKLHIPNNCICPVKSETSQMKTS